MPQEKLPTQAEEDVVFDAIFRFRDSIKRDPTLKELAAKTPFTFKHARWVINKMIKQDMLTSRLVGKDEFILTKRAPKLRKG